MLGAPHLLLLLDGPLPEGPVGGIVELRPRVGGVVELRPRGGSTMAKSIFIGDDMDAAWSGATDRDGTFLNAATVTWELKDSADDVIASGSSPYVEDSDGDYLGVVDGPTVTADLTEYADYVLELTLTQGNARGFRRIKHTARYRGKN